MVLVKGKCTDIGERKGLYRITDVGETKEKVHRCGRGKGKNIGDGRKEQIWERERKKCWRWKKGTDVGNGKEEMLEKEER